MGGTKATSYARTSKGTLAVLLVIWRRWAFMGRSISSRTIGFSAASPELPWKTRSAPRKRKAPEDVEIYHSGAGEAQRLWLPSLLPPRR